MSTATPIHSAHLENARVVQRATTWGSILAGAVAAAALSLILLALGSGLGLSTISPWAYAGASATAIGVGAIIWLILMSVVASSAGGYIAGRLRTTWSDVGTDEVYFRDTAHGFLAWAVATLVSAAVLTSAATSMLGVTVTAGASARRLRSPPPRCSKLRCPWQTGPISHRWSHGAPA